MKYIAKIKTDKKRDYTIEIEFECDSINKSQLQMAAEGAMRMVPYLRNSEVVEISPINT